MKTDLLNLMIEKTKAILAAPSCNPETRETCERWLASVDKPDFEAATKRYLEELAGDVVSIDGLIGFASSDKAKELLGAEGAEKLKEHAVEIKAKGAKFCDCAACAPAVEILERKEEILG